LPPTEKNVQQLITDHLVIFKDQILIKSLCTYILPVRISLISLPYTNLAWTFWTATTFWSE